MEKVSEMKKFTIVYGEFFNTGSHTNSITKFKHIECLPKNLTGTVEQEFGFGSVWFIFDGHCIETSF